MTNNFTSAAPDQSWLVKAVEEKPSEESYQRAFAHMERVAKDGISKVMSEHGLDIIVGPMDSPLCSLSSASGKKHPLKSR